ncbi:MAG: response regulator/pilus assembly protein [Chloroflexi bacterium]|nr:response regulator/pilus assembly protein [Chloroflexota bacterium]
MNQGKILIIDDEFPMRYLIEHQLRRQGFDVSLAKDGPSGIQEAHIQQPDIILLDAMMPGMDGFEVCAQIRSEPEISKIPIIFLTALESKEYKSRAYALGADDYLTKPFQADELIAHISAIMRRSHRNQTGELAQEKGQVVSLFSPKGGVGTTTLAIQLGEALTIQEDRPVMLIDLDLPFGGIAPMLNLYTQNNIVKLLQLKQEHINLSVLTQHAQQHRAELLVIPAPGDMFSPTANDNADNLKHILDLLVNEGFQVILDLGSSLNKLTTVAMKQSSIVFVITSGQSVANKVNNTFLEKAPSIGLESRRLMPVINELHGRTNNKDISLARVPIARIPHANERSRTRLWLKEQGMRKLVSLMV